MLAALFFPLTAMAEENDPLKIVVTPLRVPTQIERAGSAVTVITVRDIEAAGVTNILDVLRMVPGVTVSDQGGAGTVSTVQIRGAKSQHTLVLIDGVRVHDPSTVAGEFNFGTIDLDWVERIEILRGPQSALYGSDAIGGVINIISKRGRGPWSLEGRIEGGSYKTGFGALGIQGAKDPFALYLSGSLFGTEGFSRLRGTREPDGAEREAGHGRLDWQATDWLAFELAGHVWKTRTEFDSDFLKRDTPDESTETLSLARFTTRATTFEGRLNHAFTLFASDTRRDYRTTFGSFFYEGQRRGAEYQGDLRLGSLGTTVFGAVAERENFVGTFSPEAGDERTGVFALHQISLFERLHLSAGGRVDRFGDFGAFPTWRVTAAFDLPETASRLHSSVGTGAKAPSLYQRFDPCFGAPDLEPENSIGADAGLTQTLWDGRASFDVTAFGNRFRDFIDFDAGRFNPCGFGGRYVNLGRAWTAGVESTATLWLVPDILEARGVYTFLRTEDESTGAPLPRRPEHSGMVALAYTGIERLRLEGRVFLVGERFDKAGGIDPLPAYARVDLDAEYKLNKNATLYGRIFNLLDVRYEDARGYNVPGLSAYAGVKVTY